MNSISKVISKRSIQSPSFLPKKESACQKNSVWDGNCGNCRKVKSLLKVLDRQQKSLVKHIPSNAINRRSHTTTMSPTVFTLSGWINIWSIRAHISRIPSKTWILPRKINLISYAKNYVQCRVTACWILGVVGVGL